LNKIILSTHVLSDGPAQNILKYLLKKNYEILFIQHPLILNQRYKSTNIKIYKNKKLDYEKNSKTIRFIILSYFLSIFKNIFIVNKYFNDNNNYYIGFNCLNAFSGIILKKFLKIRIDKVIFFSVDYSPYRYKSSLLNYIYQFLDKFCIKNADYCWCLSQNMIDAKNLKHNFNGNYDYKFKIVPMGYWNINKINRQFNYNFLYVGNIQVQQGLYQYIELAKILKQNNISFQFDFIGDGSDLNMFKTVINNNSLSQHFKFHGYLNNFNDVIEISKRASFGLAIYETSKDYMKLINYTDSGKIKTYISLNLPFITNYEISNWDFYKKLNCSIIDDDLKKICNKLSEINSNKNIYREVYENIQKLEYEFLWDNILDKVIK